MLREQDEQPGILTVNGTGEGLTVDTLQAQGGGGTGIGAPPDQGWMLIPQGRASARTFFIYNFDNQLTLKVQNGSTTAGTPVLSDLLS